MQWTRWWCCLGFCALWYVTYAIHVPVISCIVALIPFLLLEGSKAYQLLYNYPVNYVLSFMSIYHVLWSSIHYCVMVCLPFLLHCVPIVDARFLPWTCRMLLFEQLVHIYMLTECLPSEMVLVCCLVQFTDPLQYSLTVSASLHSSWFNSNLPFQFCTHVGSLEPDPRPCWNRIRCSIGVYPQHTGASNEGLPLWGNSSM